MTSPSFATAISDRWRVTWGRKQGQAVLAMLLKQAQAVSAVLMGMQSVDFDLHPPQSKNRQRWRSKQKQTVLAVFTGTRWIRVAYVDMRDWTRIAVDPLEAPGWSIAVDLENKTR